MHITNGKDFWAGLMFVGFGLAFMLASFNYPMGSAARMGPAYFPAVLGGLLALLGVAVLFRALVSKFAHPLKVFPFRWPLLIAALALGGAIYLAHGWLKGAPTVHFALAAVALTLFIGAFGPKSMFMILVAVMIFGYVLNTLGLVLATMILVVLSALGGHDFRRKEIVILTIVLVLFGALVFVKALGLPYNLWPGA